MHVLTARNVHEALPLGINYLQRHGIRRDSRNGPVYQSPVPVTTVYERPWERVVFWPERDANPFFHLYESLWMLAGRNDLAPLVKFSSQIAKYSDDGKTVNGAYGYRWRWHFEVVDDLLTLPSGDPVMESIDQLAVIAEILTKNKDDRRCMLQMWDAEEDLGSSSKDVPCNTMATFQINTEGKLDLSVFCRSNDIIWGAYGANAVHFSFLLEYMAHWIGVSVGRYYQISVNWHGYLNTFEPMLPLAKVKEMADAYGGGIYNPYREQRFDTTTYGDSHSTYVIGKRAEVVPMLLPVGQSIKTIDFQIGILLGMVDSGFYDFEKTATKFDSEFFQTTYQLFLAHHFWKTLDGPDRYEKPLELLAGCRHDLDWVVAAKQWIQRRYDKWKETK